MAPKRPIEEDDSSSEEEISDTQNPPNPNSDSEDGEEEEEEESSSEEEEKESSERENQPVKRSPATTADHAEADDVAEDGVLGSDTASTDTVASPTASAFAIKPSKTNPNPNSAQSSLAPKSAERKGSDPSEQKKPALIWNGDAEVAVLEGILGFRGKKGFDPSCNWDAFYLFIKKVIPFDVTKSQVMEKIRRLRKKYVTNALKGDDVVFSKPHEGKMFELSKKIWGGDDNGVSNGKRKVSGLVEREGDGEKSPKSNKKVKKEEKSGSVEGSVEKISKKSLKRAKKEESLDVVTEEVKQIVVQNGVSDEGLDLSGFWDKYPRLREALYSENFRDFSEEVKRAGEADLSRIGHAKAKELEDKWKLYQVKEAEVKMMRLDIVREQTKLVIEELAKP